MNPLKAFADINRRYRELFLDYNLMKFMIIACAQGKPIQL